MKTPILRAAFAGLAALFFVACRPALQVAKQDTAIDQLKAKWIGDYVLTHPCPQIPEINLDSLCRLVYNQPVYDPPSDSTIYDAASHRVDTIRLAGISVKVPQRILVPWEDTRQLNLLKDSLRIIQQHMAGIQGNQSAKAEDCSAEVKAADKKTTKWIWLFVAACGVIVGGVAIKIYSFFTPGFKL